MCQWTCRVAIGRAGAFVATGRIGIRPFLGHHRDTVARALREPFDKQAAPRQRVSAVAVFSSLIQSWLDQQ